MKINSKHKILFSSLLIGPKIFQDVVLCFRNSVKFITAVERGEPRRVYYFSVVKNDFLFKIQN